MAKLKIAADSVVGSCASAQERERERERERCLSAVGNGLGTVCVAGSVVVRGWRDLSMPRASRISHAFISHDAP